MGGADCAPGRSVGRLGELFRSLAPHPAPTCGGFVAHAAPCTAKQLSGKPGRAPGPTSHVVVRGRLRRAVRRRRSGVPPRQGSEQLVLGVRSAIDGPPARGATTGVGGRGRRGGRGVHGAHPSAAALQATVSAAARSAPAAHRRVRAGGDQVGHAGARVAAGDQGLADQDGVGAGVGVGDQVVRSAHAGLGHPHHRAGISGASRAKVSRSTSRVRGRARSRR